MNTDLFSCLDSFSTFYGLMIVLTGFIFLLMPLKKIFLNAVYCKFSDFDTFNSDKLYKGMMFIIFCCLLILNFYSLVPFVGALTSTMWFPMLLALSLWGCILILDFVKNFKMTLSSVSPGGSPLALSPLLVIIETVSTLIRPLSLSVRLLANISAGHIILSLVAKASFLGSLGFSLFEFFVCMVQSCIFVMLLFTYNLH